jgi:deazaflavin-dependent oxidoreductase (nitroreductase family)
MHDTAVKVLSGFHAALFTVSGGRIGSRLVDNDMLLLTTVGRTTGNRHTVPLLYLRDGDDLMVIASYGGRPDDPDWYKNVVRQPKAVVAVKGETFDVEAETIDRKERAEWWPRVVNAYSDYKVYQERTEREIPVVRLTRRQASGS